MSRILIIEDNYSSSLEFGTNIAQILDMEGFKIALISNIAVGLNLAVNLEFDLIIFELNFYSLITEDILKRIKSSLKNLQVSSLLITANYEFEAISLIKELGISDYLIAPFTKRDLLAVVTNCFLEHQIV
ncbi:response regulator [Phormidium sp. LEGE 05292]|uniref:response regulator n=1 Tax=[Phormidium] sp. LEGE 05292 TaxID=767427 RepID=UPI00187EDECC|nr:response regulator [Phormidium sp. LEGE 05292]MBE9224015.1 response regulator [Phormidium sp. LEGE 05292]